MNVLGIFLFRNITYLILVGCAIHTRIDQSCRSWYRNGTNESHKLHFIREKIALFPLWAFKLTRHVIINRN